MYYLYTDTAGNDTWYCLMKDNFRTVWDLELSITLTKPLTQVTHSSNFLDSILLYSGPTIPTIDTHPELFI